MEWLELIFRPLGLCGLGCKAGMAKDVAKQNRAGAKRED